MNNKIKSFCKALSVLSFFILGFAVMLSSIQPSEVYAGEKLKWVEYRSGEILDINPIYNNGEFGLLVEYVDGGWNVFWKGSKQGGTWPSVGEVGIMWESESGKNTYYCWERKTTAHDNRQAKIQKIKQESKSQKSVIEVKAKPKIEIITEWQKASSTPDEGKVVVVRFDDGKTSTAFVNAKKEWKLDINSNNYNGGRTITNIKEWKDIGL